MNRAARVVPAALVAIAASFGASACAVDRVAEQADAGPGSEGGAGAGGESSDGAGGGASGSAGEGASGDAGSASGDAGGGASGSAGSGGGATRGAAIWTASSTAIDVAWWEYFGASMRYGKTRAELTDEELALIDEIRQDPADTGCVSDGSWASVTVTTDGVDTTYPARVLDALCGATEAYVGYSAVSALLDAAGCETHFLAGATLADAPRIRADSGCYFPLNGAQEPRAWWILVNVTEPGSLRFSFDNCDGVDPTTAALFDEEGTTELAGTTSLPGECPNLTVVIPEPGTYALHIASETAAAPDSSSFSLHVERAD